jgi:hypothetical protein
MRNLYKIKKLRTETVWLEIKELLVYVRVGTWLITVINIPIDSLCMMNITLRFIYPPA